MSRKVGDVSRWRRRDPSNPSRIRWYGWHRQRRQSRRMLGQRSPAWELAGSSPGSRPGGPTQEGPALLGRIPDSVRFAARMKAVFGLRPGQSIPEFYYEIMAMDVADRIEFDTMFAPSIAR